MKRLLALLVISTLALAQNAPAIDYGDAARAATALRQLQNLKATDDGSALSALALQLNLKAQTSFAAAEYFPAAQQALAALRIQAALRMGQMKEARDTDGNAPKAQTDQKGQMNQGRMGQDQKGQMNQGRMGQDQKGQMNQGRMGQMAPGRMGQDQKGRMNQGRMGQMAPGRMGQGMMRPGMAPQMRQMAAPQIMTNRVGDMIERAEKELAFYKGDDTAKTLIEAAKAAQKDTPMVAGLLAQAALDLIAAARGF